MTIATSLVCIEKTERKNVETKTVEKKYRKKKHRTMKIWNDSYVEKNVENASIPCSDYSGVNNFINI
jgi:hypothetical protein